jgi:hypothetical protein
LRIFRRAREEGGGQVFLSLSTDSHSLREERKGHTNRDKKLNTKLMHAVGRREKEITAGLQEERAGDWRRRDLLGRGEHRAGDKRREL